MQELEAADK